MRLEIKNLTKVYDKSNKVSDINLILENNEIYGLLGPNGSGKSTVMGMIATLLQPTSGNIFLDGVDVIKNPSSIKKVLGFLPHETSFYFNSAYKNIIFYARLNGYSVEEANRRAVEMAKQLGFEEDLKKDVSNLSNGMKKVVGIAQAIIHEPKLILLDEPFSGLDSKSKQEIRKIILSLKGKSSIIISSHDLVEIEKLCDRIGIIKNGSIVIEDSVNAIKSSKNIIRVSFDNIDDKIKEKLQAIKYIKEIIIHENNATLLLNKQTGLGNFSAILEKNGLQPTSISKGKSVEEFIVDNY